LACLTFALATACTTDDGAATPDVDAATVPNAPTGGDPSCSAKVRIGLYKDDTCTAGAEVLVVELDVSQPCSGWSRQTGTGTREDSATRFQCYRDRVCYTQYVGNGTCSAGQRVEDKEARTDCQKDPTPGIWTRILSGTEVCPEAPAGFACPSSSDGVG